MVRFFFPQEHRAGLPISLLKRVPILVNLNFILLAYFLLASFTRYRADPVGAELFLGAVIVTSVLFIASLLLIRFKQYLFASSVSMLGILLNSLWIGIFLPSMGEGDLYRLVLYVVASSVVNSMLSIYRIQILLYGLLGYLVIALSTFFVYVPRLGGFTAELRTVFLTMTLLYFPVTIVFVFTNKLANDVIKIAEHEVARNREKATALDQLIQNAKGSMEIGRNLLTYSEESGKRGKAIKQAITSIKQASGTMSGESRCADESNQEVVSFADKMQQAVSNQNAFLEETSTAITEIMTTIQNISHLAIQRKDSMDAVLSRLHQQGREITKVLEGFNKIRASSREVLTVAGGILDVSEKTNMLAMNASIEAAHAGSSGKGFAVIAGEIRKLSMETQSSTQAISQALSRNDEVVNEAASIVQNYTANTETLVKEVQKTFNAIEEIISGMAEVSVGTKELTQATASMMEVAHDTEEQVIVVNQQLKGSSESVARISEFACQLDEQLQQLNRDFEAIEAVLAKVRAIGEQNIENIEQLETDLDAINAG